MADLIPSLPGDSDDDREERDPRVIGLDSEEADDFLGAISSSTARSMLSTLHESPATPSDLATEVDTSLQNVQYHLGNLSEAGLIEVTGTRYSEKGREMNVYAPADRALVVVAGRDDETKGLKSALSRLIGGVGVLGIGAAVVNRLARTSGNAMFTASKTSGGSGDADVAVSTGNETTTTAAPAYDSEGANTTGGQIETTADGGGFSASEVTTTESAEATRTVTEEATRTVAETATRVATETPTPAPTAEPAATETTTQYLTDAAVQLTSSSSGVGEFIASLSPGAFFFLGGLTVLVAWISLGIIRS
ncbi:helix-turn-helix domain-containing protein [Haloferax sp. S1W]|uniref:ArsR/SmtB family transcription factor n=1 Tax=Haloferax sp. S1W TaxID=3377110 RepID=UPI0037C63D39